MHKQISVILCTWNNSRRLGITLDAIAGCEIPAGLNWELVVVNNNCTDDTDAVVAGFTDRLPITYVHEPKQGLSNARNAGLAAASGQFVLFTDDDVRPYPQWIERIWRAYEAKPTGYFFGGSVESEFEEDKPDLNLVQFGPYSVKGLDWGKEERELVDTEILLSANWGCTRVAIQEAGGFDPELGLNPNAAVVNVGEETDLMNRLQARGFKAWYVPAAKIRHFVPADKTSLHHVADRREASSYHREMKQLSNYSGLRIGKVPMDLWKETLYYWIQWQVSRVKRRPNALYYLRYKTRRGKMRAWSDHDSAVHQS